MEERYELHVGAYDRMMDRTGLRWYRVEGDVGMMGGLGAHEYMAPCAAGEDEVVLGEGYAANVEAALTTPGVEKQGEEYFKDGERLTLEPAIEIGNIFKLGTRYSEPLAATYVDEAGAELPIWMACYGIGPARIVAAAGAEFAEAARAVLRSSRCARQAGHARARGGRRAVRHAPGGWRGGALRRSRPRPGR